MTLGTGPARQPPGRGRDPRGELNLHRQHPQRWGETPGGDQRGPWSAPRMLTVCTGATEGPQPCRRQQPMAAGSVGLGGTVSFAVAPCPPSPVWGGPRSPENKRTSLKRNGPLR